MTSSEAGHFQPAQTAYGRLTQNEQGRNFIFGQDNSWHMLQPDQLSWGEATTRYFLAQDITGAMRRTVQMSKRVAGNGIKGAIAIGINTLLSLDNASIIGIIDDVPSWGIAIWAVSSTVKNIAKYRDPSYKES